MTEITNKVNNNIKETKKYVKNKSTQIKRATKKAKNALIATAVAAGAIVAGAAVITLTGGAAAPIIANTLIQTGLSVGMAALGDISDPDRELSFREYLGKGISGSIDGLASSFTGGTSKLGIAAWEASGGIVSNIADQFISNGSVDLKETVKDVAMSVGMSSFKGISNKNGIADIDDTPKPKVDLSKKAVENSSGSGNNSRLLKLNLQFFAEKKSGNSIKEYDVLEYGKFNTPNTVGDGLSGHELLQNAWLEANGKATRGKGLSRKNPAIALKENPMHKSISAQQRRLKLNKRNLQNVSWRKNTLDNIQIMKEAGVPREKIAELAWKTRQFAIDNGF